MIDDSMSEYLLKCPTCGTQTKMVCYESSPVLLVCQGCGRVLVMHQNRLFTVSVPFVLSLMRHHKMKSCGSVVATKLSDEAQSMIDDRKISDLHKALEGDVDVIDIIKRF